MEHCLESNSKIGQALGAARGRVFVVSQVRLSLNHIWLEVRSALGATRGAEESRAASVWAPLLNIRPWCRVRQARVQAPVAHAPACAWLIHSKRSAFNIYNSILRVQLC